MVVAAAAAVVLGGVGVGVGVGIATAAAVAVVAAAAVVVEAEVAAAAEVVIESGFHIGICCGVIGFGYGSGHAIWAGFPAVAVKEESDVFLV